MPEAVILGRHRLWCKRCRTNRVEAKLELREMQPGTKSYIRAKSFALCRDCTDVMFDTFVDSGTHTAGAFNPDSVYATIES